MSLAELLRVGVKEPKEEAIPLSTEEPNLLPPKPAEQAPLSAIYNEEELKLAQDLVMQQEVLLQADADREKAEQEAREKQAIDEAAKAAAALAERSKRLAALNNPFSTGGQRDFPVGRWVCDEGIGGGRPPPGAIGTTRMQNMGWNSRSRSPPRLGWFAGKGRMLMGADGWGDWGGSDDGWANWGDWGAGDGGWDTPGTLAWGKGDGGGDASWATGGDTTWAAGDDAAWGKGGAAWPGGGAAWSLKACSKAAKAAAAAWGKGGGPWGKDVDQGCGKGCSSAWGPGSSGSDAVWGSGDDAAWGGGGAWNPSAGAGNAGGEGW